MPQDNDEFDPIGESLNLPAITSEVIKVQEQYIEANANYEQITQDFEFARTNIKSILAQGEDALETLLDIAKQSTHPRTYEVLATFIKTLAETNKDLLTLSDQYQDLVIQTTGGPKNVTNNLYVGTPADLLKLIKKHTND